MIFHAHSGVNGPVGAGRVRARSSVGVAHRLSGAGSAPAGPAAAFYSLPLRHASTHLEPRAAAHCAAHRVGPASTRTHGSTTPSARDRVESGRPGSHVPPSPVSMATENVPPCGRPGAGPARLRRRTFPASEQRDAAGPREPLDGPGGRWGSRCVEASSLPIERGPIERNRLGHRPGAQATVADLIEGACSPRPKPLGTRLSGADRPRSTRDRGRDAARTAPGSRGAPVNSLA